VFAISDSLKEQTLSSSYLYRGRIINVRQDRVRNSAGKEAFREVVEHPGAVAVLALDRDEKVVLVRQHRQPAGEVLLEIPAGKLEPEEEPLACARRELLEETGLETDKWQELFSFYPSPGFSDEIIYLFLAEEAKEASSAPADPEENLSMEKIALNEAREMIRQGAIKDGKTIIALEFTRTGRT